MNQRRLKRCRNEPEKWTKKDGEEFEQWADNFEEDVPGDDSKAGIEMAHLPVNENGAPHRLARLRNEKRREHGMDYEIRTGLVFNKKGKVEFIDSHRKMPLNLYHAIKKSSFSGIEVQLVLEIYNLSYGFHQRNTKFLSISEIARALDATRNSVRNALRKLEERLVVYPVDSKTIQGNELCSYVVNLRFEYWEGNKPAFYRWVEGERKRWSARQVKVAKSYKENRKKQSP
jgi:hypothetical protein